MTGFVLQGHKYVFFTYFYSFHATGNVWTWWLTVLIQDNVGEPEGLERERANRLSAGRITQMIQWVSESFTLEPL